ncbi:MAG: RnfABCDGE type electron transport complex subunit G [Prevotella sp.]|nr:RnfABCDGE type electron transport complex subunit G [Bacteroides sp.]MCM1366127.1 RnfABCDGE type electron transport complex subunit G [Prevotella sp.]MCM1436808.1 RnfABCDGE type electron transport complex subunit G [Prevotella sp.]
MRKLASTFPNMLLSLGLITAISGALLGYVYTMTEEPIARQAEEAQVLAIKEVAPPFDNNPRAEAKNFSIDGNEFTVYPAKMHGELVGAAVKGCSMNGFSGEIDVMAGFEKDGTLKDYRVLQQAETPGLGSRMEVWFRDPTAARSVIGKNPALIPFYVTKDAEHNGAIDGITAATISSRAFLEALRNAYSAYCQYNTQTKDESHSTGTTTKPTRK